MVSIVHNTPGSQISLAEYIASDAHTTGALVSGEQRVAAGSLTAGAANAFAIAWQNPNAIAILIDKVVIRLTTAGGTGSSVLDVDVVGSATATGDDLIDGLDLNQTGIFTSYNTTDGGTNSEQQSGATEEFRPMICDELGGTNDYVTGKILVATAIALVGKFYIYYTGV